MAKVHVKRGDTVAILSGDSSGKRGKVLEVHPKSGKVIVEGVHIQKKHTKPTQTNPQGGIIEAPGPIDASNVAVVCPKCKKPTRVRRQRQANGELERQCKQCGKAID
ncbi:MAG: 50S ribosomal protein L24 [Bacillota bacterium]|jgi:large subunit ribosomal protein L24|nr:50S ribosomal protein L24 [Bacillota bacterium]HHT90011.1 50S ribosomal protein L24 [Bacillota bacterium]